MSIRRPPGQGEPFQPFIITGVDGGGTTGIAKLTLSHPESYVAGTVGAEDVEVRRWRFTRVETAELTETFADPAGVARLVGSTHPDAIAVEDYVQLRAAGRLGGFKRGAKKAADIAALLSADHTGLIRTFRNNAARAKRWATDKRLAAAGIQFPGMPHARDAARHALFVAVHQGWLADPLSNQQEAAQRRRQGGRTVPAARIIDEVVATLPAGSSVTEYGPGALYDSVTIQLPEGATDGIRDVVLPEAGPFSVPARYTAQAQHYARDLGNGTAEMFVEAPATDGIGSEVHRALEAFRQDNERDLDR